MDIIAELNLKLQNEVSERYGESIGECLPNGKFHRWPKLGTWVVGRTWQYNGKDYASFSYGNWKFADGSHRVDSFDKKELKNKSFLKDFTFQMNQLNNEVEEERAKKNDDCANKSLIKWNEADRESLHEYLIEKGIEKNFGSRVSPNNVLLIPVYDEKRLVGLQRIFMNPETNEFEKKFTSGIKIKGSIYPLMSFKNADIIYISEGFATSCSIQLAFPNIPTICVFNAGNIIPAIETIRKINPSCKIVICADRDKKSNTGEIFARKACKLFASCIFKIPKFKNDNGKWTDFNDLHQFDSLKAVKDQLTVNPSDFIVIQPLGVIKDTYVLMSSENPQPLEIKGHNLTEKHLYNLVPSYDWWLSRFPLFDPDDEKKENPIKINWTLAGNTLREQCHKKGIVQFNNIRSSGCWEDNGRYYYHNGFNLYDGHKQVDLFADQLIHNYVLGRSCHSISRDYKLTQEDRAMLLELFQTLSVKTPEQGLLLLGWLVTAPIAGALPWRPHIWLTGESSQGKSWTLENIIGVILKGFCIRPQGDSSEAGIRQAVGNQSLPLVFDEFETDDLRTSQRTEGVIALARQSSTPTDGDIMRGTAGGNAQTFSPNFSLCVSSINVNLSHKQDKNRWTIIEFCKERSNNEQFNKVKEIVKKLITPDLGRKLVSYVFHNIPLYLKNYEIVENYLKNKKYKGHFCRQYSALLAGVILMVHDVEVDEQSLKDYLEKTFNFGEFFEQTGEDDPEVFKEMLLSRIIRIEGDEYTIAELINNTNLGNKACKFQKALIRYGIKAGIDCFYVKKTSNSNLTNLFEKTKWKNNWSIALTRIIGASNNDNKPIYINKKSTKVIKIPFERWSVDEN